MQKIQDLNILSCMFHRISLPYVNRHLLVGRWHEWCTICTPDTSGSMIPSPHFILLITIIFKPQKPEEVVPSLLHNEIIFWKRLVYAHSFQSQRHSYYESCKGASNCSGSVSTYSMYTPTRIFNFSLSPKILIWTPN